MDTASSLGLAWIDTVGLVLVGVMLLLGAFRGLWWQVVRLLGLVGAVVLARALSPEIAPRVVAALPDVPQRLTFGAVWLVVFLAGLSAATLLGLIGRHVLSTIHLGLVDRAGGAAAGIATGALVHVALVAAVTQLMPEEFVARHVGGTHSETALQTASARWSLIVGPEARAEIDRVLSWDLAPPESPDSTSDPAEPRAGVVH